MLAEPAQDVVFHAVVEGDDRNVRLGQGFAHLARAGMGWTMNKLETRAVFVFLVPQKGFFVGDFLYIIDSSQARPFFGALKRFSVRGSFRRDEPIKRAPHAQLLREGAR